MSSPLGRKGINFNRPSKPDHARNSPTSAVRGWLDDKFRCSEILVVGHSRIFYSFGTPRQSAMLLATTINAMAIAKFLMEPHAPIRFSKTRTQISTSRLVHAPRIEVPLSSAVALKILNWKKCFKPKNNYAQRSQHHQSNANLGTRVEFSFWPEAVPISLYKQLLRLCPLAVRKRKVEKKYHPSKNQNHTNGI